jgi:hypothetical protein
MKQFNLKLLLFISIFILIFISTLMITISIGNKFIYNYHYFRLNNNIKFVVLGHSHPAYAYNDTLINNFSNCANLGEPYFFTYLKTRKIIENNNQIKTVFIEFTNNVITKIMDTLYTWNNNKLNGDLPKYFPFMDFADFFVLCINNPKGVFENLPITLTKNIEKIFLVSSGIKINLKIDRRYGGYFYYEADKTDSLINLQKNNLKVVDNLEMAKTNIAYLSKLIEFCNLNHVKVFLIRSPLHPKYIGFSNELKFREILNSKFTNLEFLDFKDFPLQNHEFGDLSHLNYKGARTFSVFFNKLLNAGLLNKGNKQEYINNEIAKNTN